MHISKVYMRFFRSFNFDYIRADQPDSHPFPWDLKDDLFYPFIRVPLEKDITAIVGANESGKSHLLSAIKFGLTGQDIRRGDFCRYSRFFAVDDSMAFPEFGLEIAGLNEEEQTALRDASGADEDQNTDIFALFRFSNSALKLYLQGDDGWKECPDSHFEAIEQLLPSYFEIDSSVPLPDSVPIDYLVGRERSRSLPARSHRQSAMRVFYSIAEMGRSEADKQAVLNEIQEILSNTEYDADAYDCQLRLAEDLLVRVAGISTIAFGELSNAVRDGREGFANGLVETMNRSLHKALNFPRWWSQDRDFRLLLTLRDLDLVFTIRDRTGTEYSFSERSGGLKYFLSYFVQYLSHTPPISGQHEVLLMDEPDAYLSSIGQQDLLKIFEEMAHPRDNRPACQVVYVTHSPFLIDKNHGERLRVLEKGVDDDGTRVVKSVARNHYEPLRSSFGSYVGESAFIGNCNLIVEGLSDQILLAGMSSRLRMCGAGKTEALDLNDITLVPAGSAPQVPYTVYLARGRDVDSPVVIVLLDGDKSGNQAKKELIRGGPRNKQLLNPKWILQISDLNDSFVSDRATGVTDIEDLVPARLAWRAVRRYAGEYMGVGQERKLATFDVSKLVLTTETEMHDAIEGAARRLIGDSFHLDKVGFARSILEVVDEREQKELDDIANLEQNFKVLFQSLTTMQQAAQFEGQREKSGAKIRRLVGRFTQDHAVQALREDAVLLFREVEASLDTGLHNDIIRANINTIRRAHNLDRDLTEVIEDFEQFMREVRALVSVEIRASMEK